MDTRRVGTDAANQIDEKIENLKEELSLKDFEIETKVLTMESEFNSEKLNNFLKFLDLSREATTFNLYDPGGFQSVKASNGLPFFISLKEVTPYMDGYKIKFNIGNPNYITIDDMTLTLDWWINAYFESYYEA